MIHVYNVEHYEIFDYMKEGIDVYAISQDDKCINLRYETVSFILDIIYEGKHGYFYVSWEEE